jgi:hypothetical protein
MKIWRLDEKRVPAGVVYDVFEDGILQRTFDYEDAQGYIFNRASRGDRVEERYLDGSVGVWTQADWDAAASRDQERQAEMTLARHRR